MRFCKTFNAAVNTFFSFSALRIEAQQHKGKFFLVNALFIGKLFFLLSKYFEELVE